MSEDLQSLTIEKLNPFPLDKALQSLPERFRDEFSSSYDLVKGYTKSLVQYRALEDQARLSINESITTINKISALLDEYEKNSATIAQQAAKTDLLYKEFITLETLQYQLISSNYNSGFLKTKFSKLTEASDRQSTGIIGEYRKNGGDMSEFLLKFKDSRKTYHGRREKLNRWSEDRVSGFI
ncbi:hypothetical protein JCM33374_g3380 [Metschnikowia sp. JCM 33374]|nr:hypothetical protein JCM33374_g3380 [Metschnikowia sp. JCM 33374]